MNAMIFAAGLGTRLKPFTLYHPKALVEVGGVAMLGRVIKKLKKAGVDNAIVNVHHFPQQIIDYLRDNGNFGIRIEISDESDKLLDTGGAILKSSQMIDMNQPLIIHNADILTDFPVEEMLKRHIDTGADATLLTADRLTSRYLCFGNEDLRLHGWINRLTGETLPEGYNPDIDRDRHLAFGGVHIINPATVLPALRAYAHSDVFSITPFYVNSATNLDIKAYIPSKPYRWHDIGKPESLMKAREEITKE